MNYKNVNAVCWLVMIAAVIEAVFGIYVGVYLFLITLLYKQANKRLSVNLVKFGQLIAVFLIAATALAYHYFGIWGSILIAGCWVLQYWLFHLLEKMFIEKYSYKNINDSLMKLEGFDIGQSLVFLADDPKQAEMLEHTIMKRKSPCILEYDSPGEITIIRSS